MSAQMFLNKSEGATSQEAFDKAVEDALYYCGHGGYTGTIAEKDSFTVIPVPEGQDPCKFAESLINSDDERIYDKWGPAGCVKLDENHYLFFGWASS